MFSKVVVYLNTPKCDMPFCVFLTDFLFFKYIRWQRDMLGGVGAVCAILVSLNNSTSLRGIQNSSLSRNIAAGSKCFR